MRTHQREKLEALRNAVLNVALGTEPSIDHQQQFLALVDRYTELHLSVLRYLGDPLGYFRARGEEVPTLQLGLNINAVDHLVKIRSGQKAAFIAQHMQYQDTAASQFMALIVEDLIAAQLIELRRVGDQWFMPSSYGPRVTLIPATKQLGKEFLAMPGVALH